LQRVFCIVTILNNCAQRISQLYEQGAPKERIGKYVRQFMTWAKGGFSAELVLDIDVYSQLISSISCPWPFEPRIDIPLDVQSINWKKQRTGEEKCEGYCLAYVPLG